MATFPEPIPDEKPDESKTAFPRSLVGNLCCLRDGTKLSIGRSDDSSTEPISQGLVICRSCHASFPIVDGILHLLGPESMDEESRHEAKWRDKQSVEMEARNEWFENKLASRLEIPQHIAALKLDRQCVLLEIGCGRGRFTVRMREKCQAILAVDFSLASLEFLAKRLGPGSNVGLVWADATHLKLAGRSFDRAFATTPLDSREQRMAMHLAVSEALNDSGLFVFSTEHYDFRTRLLGNPRLMRYTPEGSLFQRMTQREVEREAGPFFSEVKSRPIQLFLPFLRSVPVSRAIERVPVLRMFANLLLVSASYPARTPVVGMRTKGSRTFQYIYRLLNLPDTTP